VAREHTRADAYVVGRLGGGPRLPIATLDALPLHQAVDVMKRFGSAAIGGAHGGLHNMDPSRHPEAMTAGLTIAGGWPKSFEHLLDSLAARSSGEAGAWGANEVYGELVRWARRIKATAFGRQIFDRIHAVPRDSAAAAFIDEDSPVHITWIAEACGGSTTTMAQYLAALKIEPVQTASGLMAYARSDALRVVAIFKDSIGIDEVAAALDIHPTQAADLVEKGVVNSQPVHDEVDASHRRFSRAGIEALIERIAADAPVVDSALQELKPLCTRGAAIGTGGISAMIEAVLAGKARVRARLASHRGLRSLLVDPAEFRRARRLADDDRLLFKDVPKILGLHPETAWAALRVGLLVEIETNSFGVVVQRASVEQFAKKYTTAAKMAGPSKRNQRAVQRRLAEAGVRPVFSKAIHPRCKTLVYRITDIPEKILTEFPGGGFPSSAPAAATPKASASREKNTRNPETRPRRSANRPTPQSFPKTTEIDNGH
jgi:hypothetical protein